ncbi:MAG: hypothetical protein ABIH37_05655 [archaeon]
MHNKKGMQIIWVIIGLVIVVIVILLAWKAMGGSPLNSLFENIGFGKNNNTPVEWDGFTELEYPMEIVFKFHDVEQNIYFVYNTNSKISGSEQTGEELGWMWYSPGAFKDVEWEESTVFQYYILGNFQDAFKGWVFVSNEGVYFQELSYENQLFVKALRGKSPEKGLELMVNEVRKNNARYFWYDVDLDVKIGNWKGSYKSKDKTLGDINLLIDKFNQISRGLVKARELGQKQGSQEKALQEPDIYTHGVLD